MCLLRWISSKDIEVDRFLDVEMNKILFVEVDMLLVVMVDMHLFVVVDKILVVLMNKLLFVYGGKAPGCCGEYSLFCPCFGGYAPSVGSFINKINNLVLKEI